MNKKPWVIFIVCVIWSGCLIALVLNVSSGDSQPKKTATPPLTEAGHTNVQEVASNQAQENATLSSTQPPTSSTQPPTQKVVPPKAKPMNTERHAKTLEIETWLRSGSNDAKNLIGVLVSSSGIRLAEYIDILKAEKYEQIYRYLSELNVRKIEIVPSQTSPPLRVENMNFTRESLLKSVQKLSSALDQLDGAAVLTTNQTAEMIRRISELPSEAQKVNAVLHLRELTFLLERYDVLVEHLSKVEVFDRNTNHARTPREELKAVSETLFGREERHVSEFDLRKLDLKRLYDIQKVDNESLPLKLTVSQEVARSILPEIFTSQAVVLEWVRLKEFSTRVSSLVSKYRTQVIGYSKFRDLPADNPVNVLGTDTYVMQVEKAISLRRRALGAYKLFIRSHKDANGKTLFKVFLLDPEFRGAYSELPEKQGDVRSFHNHAEALRFWTGFVGPSFGKVSELLYAGRLQSVLLARNNEVSSSPVYGDVSDDGRGMLLVDHGESFWSTYNSVARAVGHLFDVHTSELIRNALSENAIECAKRDVISSGLPFKDLIVKELERPRENTSQHGDTCHALERGVLRKILNVTKGEPGLPSVNVTITAADREKIAVKMEQLSDTIEQHESKVDSPLGTKTDSKLFGGYVSYSATESIAEEAAELGRHIIIDSLRLTLGERISKDSILREKVIDWLSVLRDAAKDRPMSVVHKHVVLARKWQEELTNGTVVSDNSQPPITVAIRTKETDDAAISQAATERALAFFEKQIRKGRRVALIDSYEDSSEFVEINFATLVESSSTPDIYVFGVAEGEEAAAFGSLKDCLTVRRVSPLGMPSDGDGKFGDVFTTSPRGCTKNHLLTSAA